MKTYIFLSVFCLGVICCSPKKTAESVDMTVPEEKQIVLDLAGSIGKNVTDTFLWNSIAKKVTYIPLETKSASLISSSHTLSYMEDYILIEDHKMSKLFLFDKQGNYIRNPARQGGGAGEYFYLTSSGYNSQDSTIQVFDNRVNKLFHYNTDGKFLYQQELEEPVRKIHFSDPDFLIANLSPQHSYRIAIYDRNDLSTPQFYLENDSTLNSTESMFLSMLSEQSKIKSSVYFYNRLNSDTVYRINKQNIDFFILQKGKYSLPSKILNDVKGLEDEPYLLGFHINEIGNYYYISYLLKGVTYTDLWSKKDFSVLSRSVDTDKSSPERGFRYELKDGSFIKMAPAIIKENKIAFLIPASKLVDEIQGLEEDDNPVVVIMEI